MSVKNPASKADIVMSIRALSVYGWEKNTSEEGGVSVRHFILTFLVIPLLLAGCATAPPPEPVTVPDSGWKWFEIPEAKLLVEFPSDGRLTRIVQDGTMGYRLRSNRIPVEVRFMPESRIFITSINVNETTDIAREAASREGTVLEVKNTRLDDVTYFLDVKLQHPNGLVGLGRVISRPSGAWSMLMIDPEQPFADVFSPEFQRIADSVTLRR